MDNPEKQRPQPKAKRPYSKPAVESFELFERRSLSCGTQSQTGHTAGCGSFQSSPT